jgi:hypothetical protein
MGLAVTAVAMLAAATTAHAQTAENVAVVINEASEKHPLELPAPSMYSVENSETTYEVVTPNKDAVAVRKAVLEALGDRLNLERPSQFAGARLPFELGLSVSNAVVGTMQAPDAFSVRLNGRIFVDPRRFRALLPGRGTDSIIPPPEAPLDTVPSQVRPDPAPTTEPAAPTPPATNPPPPPPPPVPAQRPPARD